jgi:predicted extracellular nuclease
LAVMAAHGLIDLSTLAPRPERYTYIYEGISQGMDSILWRPRIALGPYSATIVHVNADYPYDEMNSGATLQRNSDHDPVLAWFGAFGFQSYLPLVKR